MWVTLFIAFALVLVIEGLGPLLFPNRWRNYISQLAELPIAQIRQLGGMLVGFGLVMLIIHFA